MTGAHRLFAVGLLIAAIFAVAPGAHADDPAEDLQSVRSRIDSLAQKVDAVTSSRGTLAGEIKATQVRMDEVLASLAGLRGELLALERDLAEKRHSLRDVQTELSAQYQSLAMTRSDLGVARDDAVRYAVESYMGAGLGVPTVALSARAWNDIGIGLVYMDRVTADGAKTVERFESLLVDEEHEKGQIAVRETAVEADVDDLEAKEQQLGSLQNELHRTNEALQEEFEKQRALLRSYDTQIQEIEGELASLQKEEASIKKLIAERAKAAGGAPGTLIRPVPGAISSPFGPRMHPIYGYVRMHNGVDMNGAMGQPIVAAADGTIILAGVKGGYGNSIMIDHGGGMVTLYGHQSKLAVSVGQSVKAGQVIGYVGSTGVSTGPHLHFEVRIDGNPVDPVKYF